MRKCRIVGCTEDDFSSANLWKYVTSEFVVVEIAKNLMSSLHYGKLFNTPFIVEGG
jgi:hypothetical protein